MKDLKISISCATTRRKISRWGVALALVLATLDGMAITGSPQGRKRQRLRGP